MKTPEEKAREMVRQRGGICLVPKAESINENSMLLSSHERTFCDCEVEDMLAQALNDAKSFPEAPTDDEIEKAAKFYHCNETFKAGAQWCLKKLKGDL